jgi:signal peptidase I
VADGVTSLFPAEDQAPRPPRPWLAALLTTVLPGAGQFYAGRVVRACAISSIALALPMLALRGVTVLGGAAERLAVLVLVGLVFFICAAVDAWHVAQSPIPGRRAWRRWYVIGAYLALMVFVVRPAIVALSLRELRVFRMNGVSMSLTLLDGDRVLATPVAGRLRPRMVVAWRKDDERLFLHRIVGMPGDRIAMRNFQLVVNGLDIEGGAMRPASWALQEASEFAWQREYLADDTPPDRYWPSYGDWGPLRVPAGHYFLLGDNRYGSLDSRQLGFVRREQIHWRARWILASRDEKTGLLRLDRMGHDVD